MGTINLYDAKTHLSELVDRAAKGEEIVIGKRGKPLARLTAYTSPSGPPRTPGAWKGKIVVHDDFDDLLPGLADTFGIPTE